MQLHMARTRTPAYFYTNTYTILEKKIRSRILNGAPVLRKQTVKLVFWEMKLNTARVCRYEPVGKIWITSDKLSK